MNKFRLTMNALALVVFSLTFMSIAQAQATRTWVSGVGDDVNPCSRTAPCKTFAGAISKTAVNGEINCLDPGGFGAVTITKSITIDCHEIMASILHSGGINGVNINFDSFTDARKSVRLRNLNFNGFNTGARGVSITGGTLATNTEVFIEDCLMDGSFGGTGNGIRDTRAGGGILSVSNTTVRDMLGAGITAAPSTGSNGVKVAIFNSRIFNCAFGVAFSNNVKASIYDSDISGNTTAVFTDSNAATSEITLDHCLVSNNGTGFNASTANAVIRIANTTAMNNTTLFTTAGGGAVQSYGNNQTGGAVLGVPVPGGQT